MDRFVTTYQKDYTRPSAKTKYGPDEPSRGGPCGCGQQDLLIVQLCKEETNNWSRLGPMGPLLDPKLYPAKTGPYPENESTKFDQPGTYLKKLEEKYPNLYGILQSTPMDETIRYVDADRMKTTYQVDYCETGPDMDDPSGQPCDPTKQQTDVDCRPYTRPRIARSNRGTRGGDKRRDGERDGKKSGRRGEELDGQETRLPPWRSEYQDNISKIGQAIMKGRLHHKKAIPVWVSSY